MSSGVDDKAQLVALRAMAHPVRLRMLSLLTGTALSAAEVARELGLTHANASYHLRLLHDAGLLVDAGEEAIRGGRAKRYRYDLEHPGSSSPDPATSALYYQAIAASWSVGPPAVKASASRERAATPSSGCRARYGTRWSTG